MKQIHFIVNPISGSGKQDITAAFLEPFFEKDNYTLVVKYSTYKYHAIALTKQSITEGATIIVACGGDGTINEVASCLVNTNIILGILPSGSGNGLATNLNLPKNLNKAISILKKETIVEIDAGKINTHFFFSNVGFGFDAQVIKCYEASKNREFFSYAKASLHVFKNYKTTEKFKIKAKDKTIEITPFLLFISNSNIMGYKVTLTPKASLQDGVLDVVLVKKLSYLKRLYFGILVLLKKPNVLKESTCFQTKKLILTKNTKTPFEAQIDGEFHYIDKNTVTITIIEKALKVIA